MLLAGHLVPVASFLLLLYWTTLAGPVWRTDGGTNVYVYSINSWMDILIYHRRNLISSLQLVKPRPRTTKSCRDYQGGTSTPRCGGPPLYEPSLSGIHYPTYSWGRHYYLFQVSADLKTIARTPPPTSACCLVRGEKSGKGCLTCQLTTRTRTRIWSSPGSSIYLPIYRYWGPVKALTIMPRFAAVVSNISKFVSKARAGRYKAAEKAIRGKA